jgi:hypothetical protein
MPFTVEDFQDLVRILEEKPEWRAALRRQVLSDELLALPEQIVSLRAETERHFRVLTAQVAELAEAQKRTEGQVAELAEAQKRTEGQVAELAEAQKRTEGQVAGLAEAQKRTEGQVADLIVVVRALVTDVGELKGKVLEIDYRTKGPAYFGRLIRRAHILSQDELTALVEDAVDRGVLSHDQAQDIYEADVVVRGRRREDSAEVYLVVEVSWGVGPTDVERAARRATLLAKVGTPTMPVVAGQRVTAEARSLAHTQQVWQLTDGHAVPPEPV